MASFTSAPAHTGAANEVHGWLVIAASFLTFAFIGLTIYVDIVTGLGNAVTSHEKDVMRFLGAILGLFASISIVLTSVLLRNGEYLKAFLAGLLGIFLNLYHLSVWMAFFAGIGAHYSKLELQSSLAYKAQQTALQILGDSGSVVVNAKSVDVSRIISLKNTLTNEELAMKKCSRLEGWRKIRACKTEHGKRWELANNELSALIFAQKYYSETMKQQLKKVAALKDLESKSKNPQKILLPLFEAISDSNEEGLKYQRYFAYLLAVIAILITDGGFFLIGGLISNKFSLTASPQKQKPLTHLKGSLPQTAKSKVNIQQKPTVFSQKPDPVAKMKLWDLFKTNYEARGTVVPINKNNSRIKAKTAGLPS